jgi:excisionase family DNA binding protein
MSPLADGPYLTVAEIAQLIKINQQTVGNWIDAGKLPPYTSPGGCASSERTWTA